VRKRRPERLSGPARPPLTFRSLDLCDGCGARLDHRRQLAGLCAACLDLSADGNAEYNVTTETEARR